MTCLLLTLCKNFKTFQKNVSISRMDEKKLHTREFQLNCIAGNMRCKLLQKRSTGKTNTCDILPLKKIFFQNLTDAFFKYLISIFKLVIPKILFILVLCSYNFYFKQSDPPTKVTSLIK